MVTRASNRQNKQRPNQAKKTSKAGKNNKKSGFVRIIAGLFKGKKLPVHDVEGLRPTTDRVKETVFNWLMFDINDKKVLDCFAGAGSLGFEALSRGAASLTLIEKDKHAATQLKTNAQTLKPDITNVVNSDALTFLNQSQEQYQLVFIDPPFRQNLASQACQIIEQRNLLTNDALVYIEVESELSDAFWPSHWQLKKEKTAGQVTYRLFSVEK
ncbi:16S rRNA (guanine(966)-N(2))-methyltransferase RsmD [Catenovulum sp. SM1970]|uniref:16S rRNA (guanine(966)-N(2))-methyltransferase RsmD n=1 Tax=Marinifaba aquimaris TaxID=2741323 RepID=UPI00157215CF|nr:16S rRNA (guanine(966)-N(2))-methyltransferase RsmD [Marinifaba aquimaris]NTS78593.1 16S rRNA (guanine(966)-N(2))-methyltransferase RsmD [Marinifaba aquimaris]